MVGCLGFGVRLFVFLSLIFTFPFGRTRPADPDLSAMIQVCHRNSHVICRPFRDEFVVGAMLCLVQ